MRRDYGPDVGVKNMKGPRDAAPPLNIRAPLAGFGPSVKRKEGRAAHPPPVREGLDLGSRRS